MVKFIQLTDTHLVKPDEKLFGIDGWDRLEKAVASIVTHHADADFVVLTGDITEAGEAQAYQALPSVLDKLPCPYYLMLGNHDSRAIAQQMMPSLAWTNDGFLQYHFALDNHAFIFLDTLIEGEHSGFLCDIRLKHLENMLQSYHKQAKDIYLFMHHPPMKIGIGSMDVINLTNSDALLNLLQHYPVKHLFMGHLHVNCHGIWHGIPYAVMKSTTHQTKPLLNDYQDLTVIYGPPEYAVVMLQNQQITIHHQNFLDDDKIINDYA
ncbi:MAG: phosphodiesterase [Alphaproteobacteria bacterium]|nr:phosphodiesterase [Alphaproteobacteria bacterium]